MLVTACAETDTKRQDALRMLDDNVMCGSKQQVDKLYNGFHSLCADLNIGLSPEEDGKAFSPCQQGAVLGIDYNLRNFTWKLAEEKSDKLLRLLWDLSQPNFTMGKLRSLLGKLHHYQHLFEGKYERSFIQDLLDEDAPDYEVVKPTRNAVSQAGFWIRSIPVVQEQARIPFHREMTSTCPIQVYADASGSQGGWGALLIIPGQKPVFCLGRWEGVIRSGKPSSAGKVVSNKMTLLEAIASFFGLLLDVEAVKNKSIRIVTDNLGFAFSFRNGHSTCLLTQTISKAIASVSKAINAQVEVVHRPRCSDNFTTCVDLLSKQKPWEAAELVGGFREEPGYACRTLAYWARDPVPERCLGTAICQEMRAFTELLDWEYEWEDSYSNLIVYGNSWNK